MGVNRELERQVTHKATLKLERSGENADVRRSTDADAQKLLEQQASEKEAKEKKKTTMKAGLDAQVAIVNERMRDARMREAHEAAEMKMRTVKQLCDELDAQERRKKVEKKEADEAFKIMCAKKEQQKAETQRENNETRQTLQQQAMADEYKLSALQIRVQKAQATQEARYANYAHTAGSENLLRMSREEQRQDKDERRHQLLTELHYSRREIARDRQRQRMVNTLDAQVDDKQRSKQFHGM